MKRFLTFIIFVASLSSVSLAKIPCIVSANKMNVVYAGISNPLSVAVYNIPCSKIWLYSNHGTIAKTAGCEFEFTPVLQEIFDPVNDNYGPTRVFVCKISGKDTVKFDSVVFRVHDIPAPTPSIAGKHGGLLHRNVLCAQLGVAAYYTEVCGNANVTRFTMTVLKSSGSWKELSTEAGPYFSEAMKREIQEVEKGARLFFSKIKANGVNIKGMALEPFMITVD